MTTNALDRLLGGEIRGLLDGVAGLPEVSVDRLGAADPALRESLEEAETRLTVVRLRMLEGYAEWRGVLAELEELWCVAARRSAEPEDARQEAAAMAA